MYLPDGAMTGSDPAKNGAGALFDFGCYGANLMTWMMDNRRPLAVTAITQQSGPSFGLATAIVLPRIVSFSAHYIF